MKVFEAGYLRRRSRQPPLDWQLPDPETLVWSVCQKASLVYFIRCSCVQRKVGHPVTSSILEVHETRARNRSPSARPLCAGFIIDRRFSKLSLLHGKRDRHEEIQRRILESAKSRNNVYKFHAGILWELYLSHYEYNTRETYHHLNKFLAFSLH